MSNVYGRQVVLPLTNKSGGGVVAGDVVIVDTANDGAFTTTTTGQAQVSVGVAQETIANLASGRVLVAGYAALVNVPAAVTRGHYVETHTVVKQATGSASRRAGSFGQFLTGGTTPTAWLWGFPDNAGASGETVATSAIWDAAGDLAVGSGANTAARLAIGATDGMALRRVSGSVAWDLPPGHEYAYAQKTTNTSITATSEATANEVVAAGAVTFDGSTVVLIEAFAAFIAPPAGNINIIAVLYDGASSIGKVGQFTSPDATNTGRVPFYGAYRLTPSAASHTYSLRFYVDSGTGTVAGGAGGSAAMMPAFIRVTKV